jgi:anthranilate phosphoribosyltransferase
MYAMCIEAADCMDDISSQGNTEQDDIAFAAAEYIREIGRGAKGARGLTQQDTYQVFSAMLARRVSDLELGALLLAWRIKGESVKELAGMLDAAHASCCPLSVADTITSATVPVTPVVIPSYNGARKQPNLVPLLAMLLAREGVPVLVHGITAFPDRITSAALFEALGITACSSTQQAGDRLAKAKLAFLPIQHLSPDIAALLEKRNILGVRNSAHTIVKMLQPIGNHTEHEAIRLVNYTHPEYLHTLTEYFSAYPANALLARGTEGEAVADARRMGKTLWMLDGQQHLMAEADPLPIKTLPELPSGLDIKASADYVRDVLSGHQPVPKPIAQQVRIITEIAYSTTTGDSLRFPVKN